MPSALGFTFADLQAFKPSVFHIPGTSAVMKPSTARSATTFSAGFLERTALRAHHGIGDRWGDGWRAD